MAKSKTKNPVGKLDLNDLGTPAKTGVTEHPVLPDPKGIFGGIANNLRNDRAQIKTLKTQVDTNSEFLIAGAVPFYFEQTNGRPVPLTGVAVEYGTEVAALVLVNDRYSLVTDQAAKKVKAEDVRKKIVEIIGKEAFAAQFEEVAVVELAVEKVAKNKQQEFIDALRTLVKSFHATDAVTVKHGFQAKDTFHAARNSLLSAEQNIALQEIYPASVSVKTDKIKA